MMHLSVVRPAAHPVEGMCPRTEAHIGLKLPILSIVARLEGRTSEVGNLVLGVPFARKKRASGFVSVGHEIVTRDSRGMISVSAVDHFPSQPALFINLKKVERHVLWPQLRRGLQAVPKRLLRLMRKSGDQIQTDIAKSSLPGLMNKIPSILSRVQAAHSTEFVVAERLRPDAQTIHAKAAESAQRDRVCRTWRRFEREFDIFAQAEPVPQGEHDKIQTLLLEQGRRATAKVNRVDWEQ